jgi:hypothetical protein
MAEQRSMTLRIRFEGRSLDDEINLIRDIQALLRRYRGEPRPILEQLRAEAAPVAEAVPPEATP